MRVTGNFYLGLGVGMVFLVLFGVRNFLPRLMVTCEEVQCSASFDEGCENGNKKICSMNTAILFSIIAVHLLLVFLGVINRQYIRK